MPWMPGMFHCRRYSSSELSVRQLLATLAQFLDHKSAHVRRPALGIGGVHAVVADQRVGHGHDLAAVGRIGQHFLVAGHRSVETNFADTAAGGAKRFALENAPIFESEERTMSGTRSGNQTSEADVSGLSPLSSKKKRPLHR